MKSDPNVVSDKKLIVPTVIILAILILLLLAGSWVLSRGVDNESVSEPPPNTENNVQFNPNNSPAEPANPNVTGGSTGTGTNTSNDPNSGTPSPAGGVDTNNTPSSSQ